MSAVRGDTARHGKEFHEHQARDKSANVSPHGDATLPGAWHQSAGELEERPIDQHDPGGHSKRSHKESERYQREYSNARVQHQVRAHDATDRTGCPYHWNGRAGLNENLR